MGWRDLPKLTILPGHPVPREPISADTIYMRGQKMSAVRLGQEWENRKLSLGVPRLNK
jgi:hypothetical protein